MRSHQKAYSLVLGLALVATLAFAALIMTAPAARADLSTVPWFDYGTVSSNSGFIRGVPTVLADQNGHFYVFYYTTTGTSISGPTNINVTKYTTGGFLGLPTKLFDKQVNDFANTNLVDDSNPFSAAIGPTGTLYVAWTKVAGGGLGNEVYVSRSVDGGQTWQAAVPTNVATAHHNDIWPFVAVSPNGTVYVAWTQLWTPINFANITIASSTNGGNSFSGVMNISREGRNGVAEIGPLAIDSHGRLYVAYMGISPFPSSIQVNVTWSDDGITWTGPTQVTPSTTYAEFPHLLVDSKDRVHLVWFDYRGYLTVGTLQAWYTESLDRGATWTPQEPISQGISSPNTYTYLAAHGNNIMVVWTGSEGGNHVLSYAISGNGGTSWLSEKTYYPGFGAGWAYPAVDENGTFYAGVTDTSTTTDSVGLLIWNGPPSTPTHLAVAPSGAGNLTASWTASPEPDVAGYEVYMSTDGVTYQLVATVGATTTSYKATTLANGTYWFEVAAVDGLGSASPVSASAFGVVGFTTQQLIDQLNTQIADLQTQLAQANASSAAQIAAAKAQIANLQSALTSLQNTQTASNAATAAQLGQLQSNLTRLQDQLNTLQGQQATQTISYANLAFEVIVVVLLIVLLLNQMRRPKSPQIMMAQPAQPPKRPEDEL